MRQTEMFCHDKGIENKQGVFHDDFQPSKMQVQMCGPGKIIKVLVRELGDGEKSPYFAWWDNEDRAFTLVYYDKVLLEICFAYGSQAEVDRGRGEVVNVFVEEM